MLDFTLRVWRRALPWFVAAAVLIPAPSASQTAGLSLVPSTGHFDCGETFTLDLMVDAQTLDLHGASVVLQFDHTILEPLSIEAGALLAGAPCPNFVQWLNPFVPSPGAIPPDNVAVDLASLGCSVNGPGSILRVTFGGVSPGTSTVDCLDVILRDNLNHDIPFVCTGATVENRCPVPDESQPWGAIKATYR